MILSDITTEVRKEVNDTATPYRYSDADLIGYLNQILKVVLQLRPDLFSVFTTFTCGTGVLQTLPADGYRISEVLAVHGGSAITEVDREALDLGYPSWRVATPSGAVNWMRHPRNNTNFFIYPPSPASPSQVLDIEYIRIPSTYTSAVMSTPILELSDAYLQTLVAGMVWLVEAVDDEHVESGRAQMFQQQFQQGLGLGHQAKNISDKESGAIPAPTAQG